MQRVTPLNLRIMIFTVCFATKQAHAMLYLYCLYFCAQCDTWILNYSATKFKFTPENELTTFAASEPLVFLPVHSDFMCPVLQNDVHAYNDAK
jgi:hypothetical protein